MEKSKEKLKENMEDKQIEEPEVYCEYFKEWISLKKGCKNLKEYCPHRRQCLIYFYSKAKEV